MRKWITSIGQLAIASFMHALQRRASKLLSAFFEVICGTFFPVDP